MGREAEGRGGEGGDRRQRQEEVGEEEVGAQEMQARDTPHSQGRIWGEMGGAVVESTTAVPLTPHHKGIWGTTIC